MNPIVLWIVIVLLALAIAGIMYRMIKGRSILDRVLASDVLLSVVSAVLVVYMVANNNRDHLILLILLSLTGFIGSVTVSRFVYDRRALERLEAERKIVHDSKADT
ncbi:monovalent cation/H+ antiporter complex subunit F [Haematomicrobium sanguinis]|uniref:monovalent cation/H+ antiporter complex subunit F n=1 Tax=Haematomicrobium sanguinis TaxID=479106 RepID=UPI000691018B|nr:monovalent cation/H+ antiporter complex subunit F [Haematomicrobium sanguinis]